MAVLNDVDIENLLNIDSDGDLSDNLTDSEFEISIQ